MPKDYESAIARAQQALVDELTNAHDEVQEERAELAKQIADCDGLLKEIDEKIRALTGGVKKRTRVTGRGDQILSVLSAHGEPIAADDIYSTLTSDAGEKARYGFALKKLVALGTVLATPDGRYGIAPE